MESLVHFLQCVKVKDNFEKLFRCAGREQGSKITHSCFLRQEKKKTKILPAVWEQENYAFPLVNSGIAAHALQG